MTRALLFDAPGPPGAPGPKGPKGDQGPQGPAGSVRQFTCGGTGLAAYKAVLLIDGLIQPYSESNLAASVYFDGVLLSSVSPGASASVLEFGVLDPTAFNLGPGVACAVGCKSDGTLCRVTDAALASILSFVGHCDVYGQITIQARNATEFNFVEWGGVGDGVTDNTPIWNAIMNACAPPLTIAGDPASWSAQAPIYFPGGKGGTRNNYFFNLAPGDSLKIWRSCIVYGDGMGIIQAPDAPSTLLSFPLGAGGFTIQAAFQHDATKEIFCAYTNIRDLSFAGPGSNGATSRPKRWAPSTHVTAGDVWVPNYYDETANSAVYTGGVMARAQLCIQSGTTGSVEPTWDVPLEPLVSTTKTDGGVVWQQVNANGLTLQTGLCKIQRCRFVGFAGNGIMAVASTSWGAGWQSSGSTIEDCECIDNGGNGIAVGGFDGNALLFKNNTCRDNYGYNVIDVSAIGNTHIGGHVSGNGAGGWWGNTSTFVQPYSESGQPNVFTAKAKVIGGVINPSGYYVPTRANSTHYNIGDLVVPSTTASKFVFYALTAGTSSTATPDFTTINGSPMRVGVNSDDSNRPVVDGGVQWWCYDDQTISDGMIMGSQHGNPGVRPFIVENDSGPINIQTGIGLASTQMGVGVAPLTSMTLASSDDSAFGNPFYFSYDSSAKRWYWTYTQGAGNRFLEYTRASATPEGQGQLTAPNGLWTGNRSIDALASSYFGPNKLRLSGYIDLNGGHYLGDKETVRDGCLTSSTTATTVAHTFVLPNDSTNGALTEIHCKVLAKEFSTGANCAVFCIRGSWYRKDATVTQIAAPEVVYGEPTDATHCSAGAASWRATLSASGTNILVNVNGGASNLIHWYVTRVSEEGTRT